jgi:hypothetical protein
MRYMLLIYEDGARWEGLSEEERGRIFDEYFAFTREVQERGAYVDGSALQPTATATTVRVDGGETMTTDGPFAETKEQLGGYYLVDVESLDEAIEWAAKIPSAARGLGSIEVRPLMEIPQEATR